VHNAKIMLGMLVKVLRGDSIATRRRLPREGDVTFEDLMSATSNFDVRTVTIEGLISVRYLLSITVRIITVRESTRSASLSWSHHTCRIDGGFRSLSSEIILFEGIAVRFDHRLAPFTEDRHTSTPVMTAMRKVMTRSPQPISESMCSRSPRSI